MKRRIACLCCGLMLLAAPGTSAGGINLAWNDCGLFGLPNMNFACNTNVGAPFVMVASFDPPDGLTSLVGGLAEIYVESEGPVLPPWWQFGTAGACRENSMSVGTSFPAGPYGCVDPWAGAASVSFSYSLGNWGPGTARLAVSFSVPEAQAATVQSGYEYYAFSISIDRANTVGAGACASCSERVCLVLYGMRLYRSAGQGEHCIPYPRDGVIASWQGGAAPGCPPTTGPWPPPSGCATPALRDTWGRVKSLYR